MARPSPCLIGMPQIVSLRCRYRETLEQLCIRGYIELQRTRNGDFCACSHHMPGNRSGHIETSNEAYQANSSHWIFPIATRNDQFFLLPVCRESKHPAVMRSLLRKRPHALNGQDGGKAAGYRRGVALAFGKVRRLLKRTFRRKSLDQGSVGAGLDVSEPEKPYVGPVI